MKTLRTILLGLLAFPLAAGTSGFSVGGGLILGLDSYKKAVNNSTGLMLTGSWAPPRAWVGIPARLNLGVATMPGKELNGLKTSLTLVQFSGDVLLETPSPKVNGFFGLSLNSYTTKFSGEESTALFDADHHFPYHDSKGLKGGIRIGLEYLHSRSLALEAVFQLTDLAGRQRNDTLIRRGAVNPGWIQLGARYQF